MEQDSQTYAIIGAAMEVHRVLGCGFLEAVYQESLMIEFEQRSIPFEREVQLPVEYKGRQLNCFYQADFVCFGDVIVELKAMETMNSQHEAQLVNYLKASGRKRGMLLNFGGKSLQYKRMVMNYE